MADGAPAPARSRWRRAANIGWLVVVTGALGWALWAEWPDVRAALDRLAPWRVVVSGLVGVVGVGVSAQIWRAVLAGLGVALPYAAAARVFFVGQLGKYLPGSVWPVLAQMELGRDHGVERRASVTAVALFLWVHLCTGVILACAVLPLAGAVWPVALVGVPAGVLLLLPGLLRRGVALLLRVTRRQPLEPLPDGRAVALAALWAAAMWLCYGLHLWLLVDGVGGAGTAQPLEMVGVFAAAWVLGFAVLVAPAGAGAREAVLVALLPLGAGAALAVAILSRALLTVADGLWGSVGAMAARRR